MDQGYASNYAELYRRHWWWRSREAFLLDRIDALGLPAGFRALDVGCGEGLLLRRLQRRGADVRGVEVDVSMLRPDTPCRERISTASLEDPAHDGLRFDLMTAFDVIEHMEDDRAALGRMVELLEPGGTLLLTVPAFMSLWDEHDVINRHFRRYDKGSLRDILRPHGEVRRLSYFYRSLYPAKLAVRWLNRLRRPGQTKIVQHAIPSPWLNDALTSWFSFENRVMSRLPAPFGTSLYAELRKPASRARSISPEREANPSGRERYERSPTRSAA